MNSQFDGVVIKKIGKYEDRRGWLMEMFRDDELPEGFEPTMGYVSMTFPGVSRGPHEHVHQTDGFCFLNGTYELGLWENRPGKPAGHEMHVVGEDNPVIVIVPPGVVHAYRNVGDSDAWVLNFPDKLYAGWGKKEPVDEIRHEEIDSEFKW
ncbi:MAG: dTDP-4-dehydrorhamnose 3,5-epimerase [Chthonomonadales bacterium]